MEAPCVQWDESRERLKDTLIRLERVRSICLPYALKAFVTIHPSRTHEFGWKRTLSKMDPQETSERTLSFIFLIIDHLCLFSSSFPSSLSMSMKLSIVHRHHNMFHQIIQSSNISLSHPSLSILIQPSHSSYPLSIIQIHHLPLKPQDIFLPKPA